MLFRQWTLFHSIKYSDYVCTKMKLWTESGQKNLANFFALIGVSKDEYNQKFSFLSKNLKDKLSQLIMDQVSKFDLNELYFTTYFKQFDKSTQLSASDVVYSLSAILEYPWPVIKDFDARESASTTTKSSNKEEEEEMTIEQQRQT